jgi:hypothetical protein
MKLQTLSPEEVAIITPRITDELNLRYFHESVWAWCRLNGYNKAAKYFKEQSVSEFNHYKYIVKILVDWNVKVQLPSIDAPFIYFENLIDVLEKDYTLKSELGEKYDSDGQAMFPLNQMLYRKIFITFIHDMKNLTEESKRKLVLAQKWVISDPTLVEFESDNF